MTAALSERQRHTTRPKLRFRAPGSGCNDTRRIVEFAAEATEVFKLDAQRGLRVQFVRQTDAVVKLRPGIVVGVVAVAAQTCVGNGAGRSLAGEPDFAEQGVVLVQRDVTLQCAEPGTVFQLDLSAAELRRAAAEQCVAELNGEVRVDAIAAIHFVGIVGQFACGGSGCTG